MKRYSGIIIGIWLTLLAGSVWGAEAARSMKTPQTMMVGARSHALGITNPAVLNDISSGLINPAIYGSVESMPLMGTVQRVYGAYTYFLLGSSIQIESPIKVETGWFPPVLTLGFNYGNMQLSSIPETTLESFNNETRVRQIGMYSSGYNLYQISAAGNFFDLFGFDILSFGASTKILDQYIKDLHRFSLSFDIGTILSYELGVYGIDMVHVGVSLIDLFASPLKWSNNSESFLPPQIFTGIRADLFNETMYLYAHNSNRGLAFSGELLLQEDIAFQAGTDFSTFSVGVSIHLDSITGFAEENYDMRVDYAYAQHSWPFDNDPSQILSFNILGTSRPKTPQIKSPEKNLLINKSAFDVQGYGPKNTTIRLYNNESLKRTIQSNRFGFWQYRNFPLAEGKNAIYATAYSIDSDLSVKSEKRIITSDTIPPTFEVTIAPEDELLVISAKPTNEEGLNRIDGIVEKTRLTFEKRNESTWISEIPLPEDLKNEGIIPDQMKTLQVFAQDLAGNNTEIINIPFFIEVSFPLNKHVHYAENIRIIGQASDLIKEATVNAQSVNIDPQNNFAMPLTLKPGKNPIVMDIKTNNDQSLSYYLKVLRLVTYPDLTKQIRERREIQFLSTIGILYGDKDGNFYPNRPVTRRYITRLLVKILDYALEPVTFQLFPDVALDDPDAQFIQTAINAGLMFGYPDLTFKPDQPLTLAETAYFLTTAGIIEEQPLDPLLEDEIVTRKELAKFLAYAPEFERKIERLIDWDKGYKIKKKRQRRRRN